MTTATMTRPRPRILTFSSVDRYRVTIDGHTSQVRFDSWAAAEQTATYLRSVGIRSARVVPTV